MVRVRVRVRVQLCRRGRGGRFVVVELVAEDRPVQGQGAHGCVVVVRSTTYLKVVWYKARHTPRLVGGSERLTMYSVNR